jgi:starvation-inducible outer membrane lipoprotein|tara:strand:+ start:288 stop:422 length:135 start_codon:yes stop_codon:yes gene_type:complete
MKYFLFVMLFLLYACESANVPKDIKKENGIQMKVTNEPSIQIKK